jgi:hypothetical protein
VAAEAVEPACLQEQPEWHSAFLEWMLLCLEQGMTEQVLPAGSPQAAAARSAAAGSYCNRQPGAGLPVKTVVRVVSAWHGS